MEKRKEIITKSAAQTKKLGKILAKEILNPVRDYGVDKKIQNEHISNGVKNGKNKRAVVLALRGDLGAGKTTFLQGFAKGIAIKDNITSPTFVIMKRFRIFDSKFLNFYHIDCYRIKKPKEIFELGFKEIISSPKNIVAIEWADRIQKIIPEAVWIRFKFMDKNKRALIIC